MLGQTVWSNKPIVVKYLIKDLKTNCSIHKLNIAQQLIMYKHIIKRNEKNKTNNNLTNKYVNNHQTKLNSRQK